MCIEGVNLIVNCENQQSQFLVIKALWSSTISELPWISWGKGAICDNALPWNRNYKAGRLKIVLLPLTAITKPYGYNFSSWYFFIHKILFLRHFLKNLSVSLNQALGNNKESHGGFHCQTQWSLSTHFVTKDQLRWNA